MDRHCEEDGGAVLPPVCPCAGAPMRRVTRRTGQLMGDRAVEDRWLKRLRCSRRRLTQRTIRSGTHSLRPYWRLASSAPRAKQRAGAARGGGLLGQHVCRGSACTPARQRMPAPWVSRLEAVCLAPFLLRSARSDSRSHAASNRRVRVADGWVSLTDTFGEPLLEPC